MVYFFASFYAVVLSFLATWMVKKTALKLNIVDKPDGLKKIHKTPTPLLGGVGIFLVFFLILLFFRDRLVSGDLNYSHWIWFFGGAVFLLVGGVLDDRFNLKPRYQIIWPILAIACVVLGNIGIKKVTNPLGGFLFFSDFFSQMFTFVWLLLMMYTTKLLDGLDGLVSGLALIGGLVIFLFSISTKYFQPDIAFVSLIFASVVFGFLLWNWHPAKIFLGESGSLLLGYILGVLAIISGGKIAIALLVLGLPLLDLFWTIIRRLLKGKNPFSSSDRLHLHHRLLDVGLGQRKTVLIFYGFSLFFGLMGLFLQSRGKFLAVSFLLVIMIVFIAVFSFLEKKVNNTVK